MLERQNSEGPRSGRTPLTRARIVEAATRLADSAGISSVTMRAVAMSLGVEAMSLYNHVKNRADLLDGMVDTVFARIRLPDSGDWRSDMLGVARSTRAALREHPWATGMLDSRGTPGEATLRHHDHVLGVLRRAGFSTTMAVHTLALVDGYVYGSVLQERSLPLDTFGGQEAAAAHLLAALPAGRYPHLAEVARECHLLGPSAPQPEEEFEFGIGLLLGALGPDEPH